MQRTMAVLVVLCAGALGGCGILVDRYDSTTPSFTVEYDDGETAPSLAVERAAEYCGVYNRAADLDKVVDFENDRVAVFDCI